MLTIDPRTPFRFTAPGPGTWRRSVGTPAESCFAVADVVPDDDLESGLASGAPQAAAARIRRAKHVVRNF